VAARLTAGDRTLVRTDDEHPTGDERAVAPAPGRRVLTGTGLEIAFGGNRALKGVDVTLDAGEVLAIVGPNGSGKTTLLNVLSGYYRLRSGRVEFLARAVRPAPSALAADGLARTFQVPKVFDDLTVGEHVALALDGRRHHPDVASRELGWALLEEMNLVDAPWDTEVRKLAHGQRRFLEIAMAFLREPHAILLDEPAAGMAVHEMDALASHLRRYAAMGGGVVLVEHHLDWLTSLASTVAVMHEGLLIWRGVPDELRDAAIVQEAFLGRGRADG
jgi:branched-chain amino acid transport system permease protein